MRELQISWKSRWGRNMNNIANPSNYYYRTVERRTYPPLVPVQLLIILQQRTGCTGRLAGMDVCLLKASQWGK